MIDFPPFHSNWQWQCSWLQERFNNPLKDYHKNTRQIAHWKVTERLSNRYNHSMIVDEKHDNFDFISWSLFTWKVSSDV